MPTCSSLLASLREIHGDERLYLLVAESVPGAKDLWMEVGLLHIRLLSAPSTVGKSEAVASVEGLRARCDGPLSPFGPILDRALRKLASEPWV